MLTTSRLLLLHGCCTPEASDNRLFHLMSLKGLKSHRTKWHFRATFKCLLNSKQSAAKNTNDFRNGLRWTIFPDWQQEKREPCWAAVCLCACVCVRARVCLCTAVCLCVFPPAWQSHFLETGWTLYTEMAIASTIHTIIQLIHTLAAVIVLSFMWSMCWEAGMETDVIMTQQWSGYFSMRHQLSSQGLATRIRPELLPHDRPLTTRLCSSPVSTVLIAKTMEGRTQWQGTF